jgi:hypothetical protein
MKMKNEIPVSEMDEIHQVLEFSDEPIIEDYSGFSILNRIIFIKFDDSVEMNQIRDFNCCEPLNELIFASSNPFHEKKRKGPFSENRPNRRPKLLFLQYPDGSGADCASYLHSHFHKQGMDAHFEVLHFFGVDILHE